jgi:tetratricopeptide (TPR) repeat protein
MPIRESLGETLVKIGRAMGGGGLREVTIPRSEAAREGDNAYKEMWRLALPINAVFIAMFALALALLYAVCRAQKPDPRLWFLFLVAVAAHSAGSIVGFVYSTFGDEVERFSSFSTFFNGLLGGVVLTDLAKENSTIRALVRSIAASAGLAPGGGGIVVLIFVMFGVLGFFTTYINKKLFLNVLTARQDKALSDILKSREVLKKMELPVGDLGSPAPPLTREQAKAVRDIVTNPNAGKVAGAEAMKADAKAFRVAKKLGEAERILRAADQLYPDDPEIPLALADVLIASRRPLEALPFLMRLQKLPNPPPKAWKLLGYASMFHPSLRDDAEAATKKYLAREPDDVYAMVNLACVYGQRGTSDPANRAALIEVLERIGRHPQATRAREKIRNLTEDGGHFDAWASDADFIRLTR